MKSRCYSRLDPGYKNYGGRGIAVCHEWRDDFKAFHDHVTKLEHYGEEGMTLDREKNDEGYYPGNVRWADRHTQATNKRIMGNNTSGYVGVDFSSSRNKWRSRVEHIHIGRYDTKESALYARNQYIIDNNLTEYKIQQWRG